MTNRLADMQLPPGNWTGAMIHLKVIRWSMINRDITSQNGSTITLNANAGCPYTTNCTGWGFFINNSFFRALFGFGIYVDNASRDIITIGNTVAYSSVHGILYQNSTGIVEDNILFDNVTGTMWADQVHLTNNPTALSAFNRNILVSNNNHSRDLALTSASQIAAADNNRYYHTFSENMQVSLNGQSQSLAQWLAASGKDTHAKTASTAFAAKLQLYVNDTAANKTITAVGGTFTDLDGDPIGTSFVLGPYTSRVVAFTPN